MNILILSNNETFSDFLYEILISKEVGAQVTSITNIASAEEIIKQKQCDITIIDSVVDDISGVDIYKELKKIDNKCKFIIFTDEKLEDGFAFLNKPFCLTELILMVKENS